MVVDTIVSDIITAIQNAIPFSIPIWFMLKFSKGSYWWDYGISFYGVITWFLLSDYFDIGIQTEGNLAVEFTCILVFSIFVTLSRVLLYKWTNIRFTKTVSVICNLLVIGFTVMLRLYMPMIHAS